MARPAAPIRERLISRINISSGGCWLWTGSVLNTGYGQIYYRGKTRTAHRLFYEEFLGPVEKDLVLDHLCEIKLCVNPLHLEPVTVGENCLRGSNPMAVNAKKTVCNSGHSLEDPLNVYSYNGKRLCRLCRKNNSKNFRRRNNER